MTNTKTPRWGTKRVVMLLGLVGAVLALATSTRIWITVQPEVGSVKIPLIEVAGSDASAAIAALAVVALAGSLAALIAGKVARYIIAGILLLAGGGIIASSVAVLANPVSASATKVGEATGLNTAGGDYQVSFWPYVAVLAGVLLVLNALVLAIAGHTWAGSKKYARDNAAAAAQRDSANSTGPIDEIDGWDSLSRGDDPT
ncbi:Trp biosynthesis-associated membrane protein [Paeniglutamicibacter kerguelensis]|uniref:Membrane protein (TIGR02234 family) n=1 Tax=Paeniglutamicibacter kerguelensis TaxID=254788 RepID=A0ABS4XDI3_9MICC|nr:Trp biosynthesis-associated membrane protein [Paeniglutamicibacter kerguelensis]MBP2386525.1 putative membrane protein (TIGR02234 family) [Paeniglutamicibacter kerguelensis]